jgi:hypothetical protein
MQIRPGLDVSLVTLERPGARWRLLIGVRGETTPMRVHLYVDGELVESWTPAPSSVTFDLDGLAPGQHAVTARAIDATGRWGGSSAVVGHRTRSPKFAFEDVLPARHRA